MAATFKLGIARISRARNNVDDGLAIELGFVVEGMTLTGGDTPASALRKAMAVSGFPVLNSLYSAVDPGATSPPWSEAFLWDIAPKGMDKEEDVLEGLLTYIAPADFGGGPPVWIVEDVGNNSIVQTFCTAGGVENIKVSYKQGNAVDDPPDEGPDVTYPASVAKVVGDRAVRVTAKMSRSTWDAMKDDIRAAACTICSDDWGGYDRGTWLFLYPTSTQDSNGNLVVSLNYAFRRGGWYQFVAYFDKNSGNLKPIDSATEDEVRSAGPPPEGGSIQYNGMAMFSVQNETDFGSTFPFTPD
jgi:hypothetical protein